MFVCSSTSPTPDLHSLIIRECVLIPEKARKARHVIVGRTHLKHMLIVSRWPPHLGGVALALRPADVNCDSTYKYVFKFGYSHPDVCGDAIREAARCG